MENKEDEVIHSEKFYKLLGEIPVSLVRWCTFIIALILISLISVSLYVYFDNGLHGNLLKHFF